MPNQQAENLGKDDLAGDMTAEAGQTVAEKEETRIKSQLSYDDRVTRVYVNEYPAGKVQFAIVHIEGKIVTGLTLRELQQLGYKIAGVMAKDNSVEIHIEPNEEVKA